jgi:hypothetical protein
VSLYWLGYIEGGSPGAANGRNWFLGPYRAVLPVDASSRADAYMKAYRELAGSGRDVTCRSVDGGLPLGFTLGEARRIADAGVPLEPGLPKAGVQIERIVRVEGPPGSKRAEVRLEGLSGIVLSSSEDEILGSWVICYTWVQPDGNPVCFTITERDVAGLVAQAEEAAVREGHEFDIEQERRRAADSILPRRAWRLHVWSQWTHEEETRRGVERGSPRVRDTRSSSHRNGALTIARGERTCACSGE